MSDHDGVLHCALRKALRAYRYARDSADFGADDVIKQEFSKYLTASFEAAYTNIAKAKEEHAAKPAFPKLFAVAHGAATDILISAARLFSHRHGMGQFELPDVDSGVSAALAARQLTPGHWCSQRDLRRFLAEGDMDPRRLLRHEHPCRTRALGKLYPALACAKRRRHDDLGGRAAATSGTSGTNLRGPRRMASQIAMSGCTR